MAVRFVLSIAGFSHDMPPLRTFDNKMVVTLIICILDSSALAVLRSQETRVQKVTRSEATSPPLPKGDLGGLSIFCKVLLARFKG